MGDQNFGSLQISKNIISNFALLVIGILLSLWYTPFLIRNLGSELYGFIPLASSVVNLLGIITLAMHQSNRRHLTVELEKGHLDQANRIFNASFLGTLLLISAATPFGLLLVFLAPGLFSAPPAHQREVQLLFLGTLFAYFLLTMQISFSIGTYARNRFDLKNVVTLVSRLCQIAIIVVLFNLSTPDLRYVAIGMIASALLTIIGDIFLWKRLLPQLRIDLKSFDRSSFKLFLGTGVWMFIYQVGAILFQNLEMLIANSTLGLTMAGMYGALLVMPKNLRVMASAVGGVWGPTIFSRYGKADFSGIDRIVRISTKLVGLTLALPIGYLCGVARPFLMLWLGPEFEVMAWVMVVMVFHLSYNLIVTPFISVQLSLGKVRLPALVNIASGLVYGLLAFFLAREYGPLGIVVTGALLMTLKNLLFVPIYTAHIMGFPWWRYVTRLLAVILWTLGVAASARLVMEFIPLTSLFNLLVNGIVVTLGYALAVFLFGLSKDERELGMNLLRRLGQQSINLLQQNYD